jgi:deaminated glutathione amidase
MKQFIAACIQTTSSDDIAENIAQILPMLDDARAQGAELITLPENAFAMRREGQKADSFATAEHAGVGAVQEWCKMHQAWVLVGSIRALEAGNDKPFNRSVLISPKGEITACYDKQHLFDVTLADGTRYAESDIMQCGGQAVTARLPWGKLGLSICYDLRFSAMYRNMALSGAELFAVPSAFTRPTGEAHWEILLRARAIENLSFVIAPAQCGTHPGGRTTYGHSMIIDPWGKILAQAGDEPCIITAAIDMEHVTARRTQLPVLQNDL